MGSVLKVRLCHLSTPYQQEAQWKHLTTQEVKKVLVRMLTSGKFDTELLGPLEVFQLGTDAMVNQEILAERALFNITEWRGAGPPPAFSFGFVKGSARATAAMFVAWAVNHLGMDVGDLGSELKRSMQCVNIRIHKGGCEDLVLKSLSAPAKVPASKACHATKAAHVSLLLVVC